MAKGPAFLSVKNYKKYQHYKDRNPPWIKLYWDLLGDDKFVMLSMADRGLYCHFLLLASRHDNYIPFDLDYIQLQLKLLARPDLSRLIHDKFLLARCKRGASKTLEQSALPSTEFRVQSSEFREKSSEEREEAETDSGDPLFEFFFEEFPARNGKKVGKEQARAKFDKLPPEDQEAVLVALQNFKASKMVQDGIGIPDPHRFLVRELPVRSEPWRDWLTPETKGGPAVKCTWQVKHGHQLRPCGELVEPELSAKGEKTCQAHQEAKKQRQQRVAEMRGDEVTV